MVSNGSKSNYYIRRKIVGYHNLPVWCSGQHFALSYSERMITSAEPGVRFPVPEIFLHSPYMRIPFLFRACVYTIHDRILWDVFRVFSLSMLCTTSYSMQPGDLPHVCGAFFLKATVGRLPALTRQASV